MISSPPPLICKYRSTVQPSHQGPSPYPGADEDIRLAVDEQGGTVAECGSSGSPILDSRGYTVYGIVFGGDLQIMPGKPLYAFGNNVLVKQAAM